MDVHSTRADAKEMSLMVMSVGSVGKLGPVEHNVVYGLLRGSDSISVLEFKFEFESS